MGNRIVIRLMALVLLLNSSVGFAIAPAQYFFGGNENCCPEMAGGQDKPNGMSHTQHEQMPQAMATHQSQSAVHGTPFDVPHNQHVKSPRYLNDADSPESSVLSAADGTISKSGQCCDCPSGSCYAELCSVSASHYSAFVPAGINAHTLTAALVLPSSPALRDIPFREHEPPYKPPQR